MDVTLWLANFITNNYLHGLQTTNRYLTTENDKLKFENKKVEQRYDDQLEKTSEFRERFELALEQLSESRHETGELTGRVVGLEGENGRLSRLLEDSIGREREISDRLQKRIGLLKDGETLATKTPQPVPQTRQPWSSARARLEADDRKRHWEQVIDRNEKKDSPDTGDVGLGREPEASPVVGEGESAPEPSGEAEPFSTGTSV